MRRMKDSGIAWIGEIPEGWEIKRLKFICTVNPRVNIDDINLETEVSFLPMENIKDGYFINTIVKNFSEYSLSYNIFNNGDILLAKVTPCFENGNIAIANNLENCIGFGTSEIFVVRVNNIYNKFLFYYFRNELFRQRAIATMSGTGGLKRISPQFMRDENILFPPLPEQHSIADYLDTKCAEIDRSMDLVRQGIDKLKEYKKSVITEAVTKGLDPDVPMKDSGVPWIGEIPEAWKISSVRWEFVNLDGQRKPISSENRVITHGSYNYYGASGVIDKIDEYIFDEPLILIGEDGANLALRNLPLIYVATGKYWVNNHAHILKPKIQNALFYMAYQLECVDLFHFLTGSTQPKLTQANLSKIPVVCPPLTEQHRIISYLDAKCAEIDTIIAKKQALLDKLAAYKKSLIFECVTGKREVAA